MDVPASLAPPPPPPPPGIPPPQTRAESLRQQQKEQKKKTVDQLIGDLKKRLQWKAEVDEEDLASFFVYHDVDCLVQEGPQCGLVALCMAGQVLRGYVPLINYVFHNAKDMGFTKQGEMFSAANMCALACKILHCRGLVLPMTSETCVTKLLTHTRCAWLVPYDRGPNHAPCSRKGHAAHWAMISGVVGLGTKADAADLAECLRNAFNGTPKSSGDPVEETKRKDDSVEEVERKDHSVEEVERKDHAVEEVERKDHAVEEVERKDNSVEEVERKDHAVEEVERKDHDVEEVERKDQSKSRTMGRDETIGRDETTGRDETVENIDKKNDQTIDKTASKRSNIISNKSLIWGFNAQLQQALDESTAKAMCSLKHLYVFSNQGKSIHTHLWDLEELVDSNHQLNEVSPDITRDISNNRGREPWVLGEGIVSGLCGKAVFLWLD